MTSQDDDTRPPAPAKAEPISLRETCRRLARAFDTNDVGHIVQTFLADRFSRVALFRVQARRAVGWMAQREGINVPTIDTVVIDLDADSAFAELDQGFPLHRGTLDDRPPHRHLATLWRRATLPACLLVPVWLRGKLVSVLYCDRDGAGLGGVDLDELDLLAAKTALALELCIVRRKIEQQIDAV